MEHVRGGVAPGGQDTTKHQLLSTTQHKEDLLCWRAGGGGAKGVGLFVSALGKGMAKQQQVLFRGFLRRKGVCDRESC